MKELTRVAMIMGKMSGGGVEAVVMNYYRHIDKTKFQFDFIVDSDSKKIPETEIYSLGGKIYKIPPYQNIVQYNRELAKLFSENKYSIVHSHINTLSVFPLRVAKKAGIPLRIAHNHSVTVPGEYKKNGIKKFLRMFSTIYPTHYIAPTKYTGEWLFGEKVSNNNLLILKNAIDVDRFKYNPNTREKIRKRYGFGKHNIVIGNIGRMVSSKNLLFLLDIFNEVLIKHLNFRLILIGNGPMKEEIIKKVNNLKINNFVVVLDNIDDIENYYQAMDLFLFPSSSEGLGMVAIEAQASGLPVISSSYVPKDIEVSDRVVFLSIKESETVWVKKILENSDMNIDRTYGYNKIKNSEYNIVSEVRVLEKYYQNMLLNRDSF